MSRQIRIRFTRRQTARVAVLAATGLSLACCSGAVPPLSAGATSTPAPTGSATASANPAATPPALGWTEKVCSALDPVVGTLTSPPQPDLNNLAASRQSYLAYLGDAAQQAADSRQQISAAGNPPVADGDKISSQIREQVTRLGADIDQARTQIQQTDPNDAGSLAQALTAAGNVGGSLAASGQILATLRQNSQLGQAVNQSPSCASLRSMPGGS